MSDLNRHPALFSPFTLRRLSHFAYGILPVVAFASTARQRRACAPDRKRADKVADQAWCSVPPRSKTAEIRSGRTTRLLAGLAGDQTGALETDDTKHAAFHQCRQKTSTDNCWFWTSRKPRPLPSFGSADDRFNQANRWSPTSRFVTQTVA